MVCMEYAMCVGFGGSAGLALLDFTRNTSNRNPTALYNLTIAETTITYFF